MTEKTRLDELLAPGGLRVLFQPIFEIVEGGLRIHSLECLSRGPRGTSIERADVLFDYVRLKREETVVDRLCIDGAIREAATIPLALPLNINVHASTIGRDPGLTRFICDVAREHGIDMKRIVIEIVDHSPSWDGYSFQASLELLRAEGVTIALDDVGVGHSNYRMILQCRPEYLKIDRYLVAGVHRDTSRQAAIESIVILARGLGTRAVAEGVECLEDFLELKSLGVDMVQGFLFAGPMTARSFSVRDLLAIHPIVCDTADVHVTVQATSQSERADEA